MNKIAQYLNEHLVGEVSSLRSVRRRFSQDGSVLTVTPEIVHFPKVTNDIRKVARFAWQLAEKGHVMGVTVRGAGADTTGAAIGKGVIINTSAHLNNILYVGVKERIIHLQPGVTLAAATQALSWQGLCLVNAPIQQDGATIGGLLAGNASGTWGAFGNAIQKLEVVLANGDVIETSRLSRKEVNKRKGLQTLEGEIYRQLDGLFEDNAETIKALEESQSLDAAGYSSLARVRDKDGSIDLTPLFVGSQGTLGIISEIVLKTDFYAKDSAIIVAALSTKEMARDVSDGLKKLEPSTLEMIDGELFAEAQDRGKKYAIFGDTSNLVGEGAVVYISFDDYNERARTHKLKKATKLLEKSDISFVSSENEVVDDMKALRSVASQVAMALNDSESMPPVIDGAYIPQDRHEEFTGALQELQTKIHVTLPLVTNMLTGIVNVYPILHLGEVSDKQKVFKLMNEYAAIVSRFGGDFIGVGSEGRLKANAAWTVMNDEAARLYEQLRTIFDPFGTLNPGVKQKNDVKQLVQALRTSYDHADLIDRGFER